MTPESRDNPNDDPHDRVDEPVGFCAGGVPVPPTAILLAAGQSKRMQSDLVKVLHEVCGRPMLAWVIDACKSVGCTPIYIIVGHQGEQVRSSLGSDPTLIFIEQRERLGTGHAVQQTEDALADFEGDVIVLAGDGPLIRGATLRKLIDAHASTGASASIATSVIEDPTGYGRILRDEAGEFEAIVEQKDASEAQQRIREVNPSYYCFRSPDLFDALRRVHNDNASGEYYLTDVLGILREDGKRITVVDAVPPEDVLSINTREQLAEVDAILSRRLGARQEAGS